MGVIQDILFKKLEDSPESKAPLTRAFFIILLDPQLFSSINSPLLDRLSLLLQTLPESNISTLTEWLRDVDAEKFSLMIAGTHNLLGVEIRKLLPGPEMDKIDTKAVTESIMAACKFMRMLYKR